MKLRNKVLISMTVTWVIFVLLIYLGVNYFLMKSFLNLEADRANRDLGSKLLNPHGKTSDLRGYISIPNGIMMVAALGVTDGNGVKPAQGTMISGRIVSEKILQKVKEATKLELSLLLPSQIKMNNLLK